MPADLAGKRILFMAPRFFGYERDIIEALRGRGATVDWLPDRPFDTPLMTAVTRFQRSLIMPAAYRLYRRLLDGFGRPDYDIVFIVNGQTLPRKLLAELRAELPRARFVLYMWDSLENRGSIIDKFDLFDEWSSFDPRTVARFGMPLRPLFFVPGFERPVAKNFDHDISFIGTAHTDRYAVVSKVDAAFSAETRRFWYLYLQAPWVFRAYKVTNPVYRNAKSGAFKFTPIAKSDVQDIFQRSRAVLDIEHPRQVGLTMRTLETVGASKKLVTTNASVRDYDFFDPHNVCVIDREKPVIPPDFLRTPYRPIPDAVYARYRLDGWIDELLGPGGPAVRRHATPAAPVAAAVAR
jgi:hypothetical protein